MVAAEVVSSYLNTPAKAPYTSQAGLYDLELVLIAPGTDIASTASTTAIDVEGGSFAEWVTVISGDGGTDPTLDLLLSGSFDGSTWFRLAELQQITGVAVPAEAAVAADPTLALRKSVPVFIPKQTSATLSLMKVRITHTIGGSATPCFDVTSYLTILPHGSNVGFEEEILAA